MTTRSLLRLTVTILAATAFGRAARAAEPAADAPCFLWEATAPTGTVYLLGSIHVGHPSMFPLAPVIEKAFSNSSALVVEVHVTPEVEVQSALLAAEKGTYPAGETLQASLSADTLKKLRAYLGAQRLTLDPFNSMRPWLLGLTLVMREYLRLGYDPKLGLDSYFVQKAGNKEILELETVEKQLDVLSSGDREVQDLSLREMLEQIETADDLMKRLIDAWRSGDADAVDRILKDSFSEEPKLKDLHKLLLDDRNVAMAAKIREYMKAGKSCFVVVGSAHLVGTNGIVRLLQDGGCTVKQLRRGGAVRAAPPAPAGPVVKTPTQTRRDHD